MSEDVSFETLASMDLAGRPFVSMQGRTFTRGQVSGVRLNDTTWFADLHAIEIMARGATGWAFRCERDEYCGSRAEDRVWWMGIGPEDTGPKDFLYISGYGMYLLIGPNSENPWSMEWPDAIYEEVRAILK